MSLPATMRTPTCSDVDSPMSSGGNDVGEMCRQILAMTPMTVEFVKLIQQIDSCPVESYDFCTMLREGNDPAVLHEILDSSTDEERSIKTAIAAMTVLLMSEDLDDMFAVYMLVIVKLVVHALRGVHEDDELLSFQRTLAFVTRQRQPGMNEAVAFVVCALSKLVPRDSTIDTTLAEWLRHKAHMRGTVNAWKRRTASL